MKKHRLLLGAALLVLVALVMVARWQQPGTAVVPPPAGSNTVSPAGRLVAQITRQPRAVLSSPTPVKLGTRPDGALRFLGVQPGWQLMAGTNTVPGNPEETARGFLLAQRSAFGLANPRLDLTLFRTLANPTFTTVRLQQTYASIPVLAAEAVVHVGHGGEIRTVLADLATELPNLDGLPLPLVPAIAADEAPARAVAAVRARLKFGPLRAEAPRLVVYVPEVLGLPGEPALAWEVPLESPGAVAWHRGRAIVHATSGALLNFLDETHSATQRRIYDDNSSTNSEPVMGGAEDNAVRVEGGKAVGILEVDDLYDYIGQTDALYLSNHQRNGYNGSGGTIFAVARSIPEGKTNWANASASGNTMRFGVGFVTDDIVAHEYTHLVTEQTSRLLYQNASGAINESFSDIWGEFLDLTNGGQIPNGGDLTAERWLVGEDRPGGALRSMRDPPVFNDTDRRSSTNYVPVAPLPDGDGNDQGGVHSNSGVGNKLCYLLTDGDTFNGETVQAEGFVAVAQLFYHAQVNLLVPASDWRDLYFALLTAGSNLGWSSAQLDNLDRACAAVEISDDSHDYFVDRSSPATTGDPPKPVQEVGIPQVVGDLGPFRSLPAGLAAVNQGGRLHLNGAAGTYQAGFGGPVTLGKPVTLKAYNASAIIVP